MDQSRLIAFMLRDYCDAYCYAISASVILHRCIARVSSNNRNKYTFLKFLRTAPCFSPNYSN